MQFRNAATIFPPIHFPIFLFPIFIFAVTLIPSPVASAVLVSDDLFDGKSVGAVSGGTFTSEGWTTSGGRIIFDMGKQTTEGGVQVWVKNFNPPKQASADKQHIFAGRSDKADKGAGGKDGADWWAFRAGNNYSGGSNGTMKTLANIKGVVSDDKQEARVLGSQSYNTSETYTLKTTWKAGKLSFHFNGKSFWNASFKAFAVQYIYVGNDIYHGYPAMNGPIWVKIAAWEGTEPSGLGSISETPTILAMNGGKNVLADGVRHSGFSKRYTLTSPKYYSWTDSRLFNLKGVALPVLRISGPSKGDAL